MAEPQQAAAPTAARPANANGGDQEDTPMRRVFGVVQVSCKGYFELQLMLIEMFSSKCF
jgi:hypothetical protein